MAPANDGRGKTPDGAAAIVASLGAAVSKPLMRRAVIVVFTLILAATLMGGGRYGPGTLVLLFGAIAGYFLYLSERDAEEKAQRNDMLAVFLENVADPIEVTDSQARLLYVNPAYERKSGYRQDEIIGKTPGQMFRPDGADPETYRPISEALDRGEEWRGELPQKKKDGTIWQAQASISPVFDAAGHITHYVAIKRDISILVRDRDLLESLIHDRTRELTHEIEQHKRTEETLILAKEEAELASRAKTEFLANVSHELRTPLNAVIGFSEILKGVGGFNLNDDKREEYAKDIFNSGSHLLRVINEILDVSRIEAGKMTLSEEIFDFQGMLDTSVKLMSGRVADAGLSLTVDSAPEISTLFADETKVRQIFLNLLANAAKFTESGGAVKVTVGLDGDDDFFLTVADNGIGIAEDHIDKVVRPFIQADNIMTRRQEGTGLGLYLCKRLTEMHGGELTIESTLGVGTSVTAHLPGLRVNSA